MRRSRVLRRPWRHRRWSRSQMLLEPVPGELGDPLERAGFFEQVCRVRYDFQALFGVKSTISVAVELENDRIVAAHDEKRRRVHVGQLRPSEVRTASAGDDGR